MTVDVKRPVRHWPALTSLSPSLVHRGCITNSGCSSISAHKYSPELSQDEHVHSSVWLHCGFPVLASASSASYLSLALVFVPHTRLSGVFFGASTLTSLKYLALFAVGEVRLVYSRWVISATMWSCCQVGWQSMDCLWITLCICVPGLGTLWRTLTDWVSCASVHQMGPGEIPQKRVFFSLKMYMKNLSAFQLVFRIFLEKT